MRHQIYCVKCVWLLLTLRKDMPHLLADNTNIYRYRDSGNKNIYLAFPASSYLGLVIRLHNTQNYAAWTLDFVL